MICDAQTAERLLQNYYNLVDEVKKGDPELDRQIAELEKVKEPPQSLYHTDTSAYIRLLREHSQATHDLGKLHIKKAALLGKKNAIPDVEMFMSLVGIYPQHEKKGSIDDKVSATPGERKKGRESINTKMEALRTRHKSFFDILNQWQNTGRYSLFIAEYRSNHKDIDSLFQGISKYSSQIGKVHRILTPGNGSIALAVHDYVCQKPNPAGEYVRAKYRLEKAVLTAQRDYLLRRSRLADATKAYLGEFRSLNKSYMDKCREIIQPKRNYFGRIVDSVRNFFSNRKYALG